MFHKNIIFILCTTFLLILVGCNQPVNEKISNSRNIPSEEPVPALGEDVVVNNPGLVCSTDPKEAYQQFIQAYNKVNYLMQRGEGDTPASRAAYIPYEFYKNCWEAFEIDVYDLNEQYS